MMKLVVISAIALFCLAEINALDCWTCNNVASNEECEATGSLRQCLDNEDACQNEVRNDNGKLRITKRCKQAHACDNNFIQNPRAAWDPSQCNPLHPNSVCRCCCNEDGCNGPQLFCIGPEPEPTTCPPPQRAPANGEVVCSNGNERESVCQFTCNAGYYLRGFEQTRCRGDRTWSNPAPTCQIITCPPVQTAPLNGRVACTRGNRLGSICTFTCDRTYELVGDRSRTCRDDNDGDAQGEWTNTRPTCQRSVCTPVQVAPANGGVDCTNANIVGSVCAFTCIDGYFLSGSSATTCEDDLTWSNPRPRCIRITCPPPRVAPANGDVLCSAGINLGSVCDFTCDSTYELVGARTTICQDDLDGDAQGVWNNPNPTCRRLTCNPAQVAPANGGVDCSNANIVGSVCSFTCDDGYYLSGSTSTLCDNDLTWTNPRPTCVRITCPPARVAPENGDVLCSAGINLGSVCDFTCDTAAGYALIGASSTTCIDDNNGNAEGVWSNPNPICQPITCQPEQTNPTNGNVTCTNGNRLGSTCTFTCQLGYGVFLPGNEVTVCEDDGDGDAEGQWSRPTPVCRQVCEFPRSPQRAFRQCTLDGEEIPGDFIGTVCRWSCFLGTQVGNPVTECVETIGGGWSWNREPATCPL